LRTGGWKHFVRNQLRGISDKQKNNFFRQLAILTNAGVSILDALKMLQKSSRGNIKYLISDSITLIEQGHDFSRIGVFYTKFFDKTTIAMINAGEKSGNLPQVFQQVHYLLEKKRKFKSKIKGAMMMPIFTLIFAIGVVFFMAIKVIPEFSKFLTTMGAELPLLTQYVLDISDYILENWRDILTYIGASIGAVVLVYMSLKPVRYLLDYILINLPLVGGISLYGNLSNFSSNMSQLFSSGVNLIDCLNISRDGVSLLPFQKVINTAKDIVISGGSFSDAFKESSFIPIIFSDILQAGEQSGSLDHAFEQLTLIYEEEANVKIAVLQAAIPPIMTIFIGALVGIIAASLIMGMMALWSATQ